MKDYAEGIKDVPELLDIVVATSKENQNSNGNNDIVYEEHLTQAQMQNGIKKGTLIQASLNISQHNVHEATAVGPVNGEVKTIYILGRKNINRSIQGDIVALQILPKSEWKKHASVAMEDDADDDENDKVDIEKEEEKQWLKELEEQKKQKEEHESSTTSDNMDLGNTGDGEPTAKVVGIIRKKWRPYCGFIIKKSVHSKPGATVTENVLFRAMDRRIPPIKMKTSQAHNLLGKRIVVSIDQWPLSSMFPLGHFVKTLGASGDKETETEVLLLEHDVPYQEFSKQVLADLPREGEEWVVTDQHVHHENRRDLRGLNICSIDPPGCTDIDDALHVRPLENGNYEVGVRKYT